VQHYFSQALQHRPTTPSIVQIKNCMREIPEFHCLICPYAVQYLYLYCTSDQEGHGAFTQAVISSYHRNQLAAAGSGGKYLSRIPGRRTKNQAHSLVKSSTDVSPCHENCTICRVHTTWAEHQLSSGGHHTPSSLAGVGG
jgi:hypothetical protein